MAQSSKFVAKKNAWDGLGSCNEDIPPAFHNFFLQ